MKEDLYKNYTSTSVLYGVDVEKFTRWSHLYFRKFILPHLPASKDAKILEIGCGYGRYTGLLTHDLAYKNIIGIDISQEQIEYAREHYNLKNVFCVDAVEYLQNDLSKKYDVIILMDVLEHLELSYAVELLKLINQSLSPGGKLIIQVPNGLSPLKPIFYGDVTHVRAFSAASISQILRMSGFPKATSSALPPLIHNIKSFFHWLAWTIIINPCIYIFVVLSHGSVAGGIFSSNLLTVAQKE